MSKFSRLYSWYFGIPLLEIILIIILSPPNYDSQTRLIGALAGVVSYVFFTFEFILTARPAPVEKAMGQDKLIKFHMWMSVIALLLAVLHMRQTMSSGEYKPMIPVIGYGILIGYTLIILLAYFFLSKKPKPGKNLAIRYHTSMFIHNFSMLVTVVLLLHVMQAEATQESLILKIVYIGHFLVALGYWIYHKIVRAILLKKNPYTVTEIRKETKDIWALVLSKVDGKVMDYEAGQFGYLSILQKGFSKEFHPFSYASSPKEDKITILIKELGDYTLNLGEIKVGTTALLDGPYGSFKPLTGTQDELVFIAGGIGITPFLSSLGVLKETAPDKKVTLLYGMRTKEDLIKTAFFEDLEKNMPNFRYVPVLSDDDSWAGDVGFIDQPCLEKFAACEDPEPENQTKEYYICGPPLMISLVRKSLRQMEVSYKFVHVEEF
ncbi:MAG: ferredoxin reductase family protein [Promethearchaeota archaeon]